LVTTCLDYCNSTGGLTLEPLLRVQNCAARVILNLRQQIMLSQLWSSYTGCQSKHVYSLSCARWCMESTTVSARRTCLMLFSRSWLRRCEKVCDQLRPRTMWLRDCGRSLASVRSHTLVLLPGINFQKLSARHKHNRTSRNLKTFPFNEFLWLRFITDFVMSAVLIFVSGH